jgi:hypothetical protein
MAAVTVTGVPSEDGVSPAAGWVWDPVTGAVAPMLTR